MFRIFEFCVFISFCSGEWIFVSDGSLSFLCLKCWTINCIRFSWFFKFDFTFRNQECLFVTVILTLCLCSSHSRLYHSSFVSWHLPLCSLFWFFQLLKNWVSSFFLDFCHFFGLQLIWFNIKQYWEFASKLFPEVPLLSIYCNFLPSFVLFLNDFCLWISFCCLCIFYD